MPPDVTGDATGDVVSVPLRNARERVLQTLWFEAGGLLLVTPLVAWVTGAHTGESLLLLVVLSVAVMVWATIYNTVFDRVEARLAGRVASARPHRLRVLHALGLEVSSVLATWPIIVAMTGLGWWQALAMDIALSAVYAAYGYFYHWLFDRLRPVRR
jgi:uncharacterized membrane protein